MSNQWGFTVDSQYVSGIAPSSGDVGTTVTFSGYSFGTTQDSSIVSIGNAAANAGRLKAQARSPSMG
jgi:IPT/TIG domain